MAAVHQDLPALGAEDLERRIERCGLPRPGPGLARALVAHYEQLRRWGVRLSLVGPGTWDEVVERHYAEALSGSVLLDRLGARPRVGVDLGTGAGFPGWVLAAARPGLRMTLIDSRERKLEFLRAATRAAGRSGVEPDSLSVDVLGARVTAALPPSFPEELDLVTIRALKLSGDGLAAVAGRLRPEGLWLSWAGESEAVAPAGFVPVDEEPLAGSRSRRVVAFRRGSA